MDAMTSATDNTGANLLMTQDYAAVYQKVDDMYATNENQLSEISTQNPSDDSDIDDPQYSPEGSHNTHISDNEYDREHSEGITNRERRKRRTKLDDKETQTEEYEDSIADTLSVSTVDDMHDD
jgi:hypothetical protein